MKSVHNDNKGAFPLGIYPLLLMGEQYTRAAAFWRPLPNTQSKGVTPKWERASPYSALTVVGVYSSRQSRIKAVHVWVMIPLIKLALTHVGDPILERDRPRLFQNYTTPWRRPLTPCNYGPQNNYLLVRFVESSIRFNPLIAASILTFQFMCLMRVCFISRAYAYPPQIAR